MKDLEFEGVDQEYEFDSFDCESFKDCLQFGYCLLPIRTQEEYLQAQQSKNQLEAKEQLDQGERAYLYCLELVINDYLRDKKKGPELVKMAMLREMTRQVSVAREIGIKPSHFCAYLAGTRPLPDKYKHPLAKLLSLDASLL